MVSAVLACVNDHERSFQLSYMQRPNFADVSIRGESFTFRNDWSFIVVNVKLAFDLDIVATSHATGETAEPRTGADDPMRDNAWSPLVGGDVPGARHRRKEEDGECVFGDAVRRRYFGILREEAT